jgi:hypothetical protein
MFRSFQTRRRGGGCPPRVGIIRGGAKGEMNCTFNRSMAA